MIAEQVQQVPVQRGRAAVAPVDLERPVLPAEVAPPARLAIHPESDHLARAEPGIDALAVGHGAGAGQVVLLVHGREVAFRGQPMLPEAAAVGPLEGLDRERDPGRAVARGGQRLLPGLIRVLGEARMASGPEHRLSDLRRHEDAFAPHHGGGDPDAGQARRPGERGRVPARGQSLFRRHPGAQRTAPLGPVLGGDRRPEGQGQQHRCGREPHVVLRRRAG